MCDVYKRSSTFIYLVNCHCSKDDENEITFTEDDNNCVINQVSDDINKLNEVELGGCGGSLICDPRRNVHRFVVLIFMAFLGFGSYFCYDNPGALEDEITEDMGVSSSQYMMLYSLYSWPNVIMCFIGGFLIDRVFGIRLGAIIFAIIILIGQIIFAMGAFTNLFWLMDVGRFIFGIGGESLAVAQNTYACSWFMGKELNMVFGIQLSISRVGSTVNFNVMKPLYNRISTFSDGYTCLGIALLIAASTCVFSLICALIMGYFDRRAEKILNKKAGETGEVVQLKDAKDFPIGFWMICIICVAYYVAIFPFTGLGVVFFERKFEFSPSSASAVNMTIGSHALMAFTFLNPFVAMVIMGTAYSLLASALWPMVSLLVPQHQLGTAYGVMQSVQNLGLAVISLIVGLIVDSKGYLVLEIFFLACLCIALVATIVLWLVDDIRNGILNLSIKERKKRLKGLESVSEKKTT
ncbi:hypothetical protein CHUAL_002904 [Chamberlinius hualienensis]